MLIRPPSSLSYPWGVLCCTAGVCLFSVFWHFSAWCLQAHSADCRETLAHDWKYLYLHNVGLKIWENLPQKILEQLLIYIYSWNFYLNGTCNLQWQVLLASVKCVKCFFFVCESWHISVSISDLMLRLTNVNVFCVFVIRDWQHDKQLVWRQQDGGNCESWGSFRGHSIRGAALCLITSAVVCRWVTRDGWLDCFVELTHVYCCFYVTDCRTLSYLLASV